MLWFVVGKEIAEPNLGTYSMLMLLLPLLPLVFEYYPTVLSERSVNHSSCKISFAVSRSLGSSFMILSKRALSALQISFR
jgi:hypothetical protein